MKKRSVSSVCQKLFDSYLSKGDQNIMIGGEKIDSAIVNYGVPQSTVLGPILFLLHKNNLYKLNFSGKKRLSQMIQYLFSYLNWEETKGKQIIKLPGLNCKEKPQFLCLSPTIHGLL